MSDKANTMTVSEFARMGGHARKKALTATRRKQIARDAGLASAAKRKASKLNAAK